MMDNIRVLYFKHILKKKNRENLFVILIRFAFENLNYHRQVNESFLIEFLILENPYFDFKHDYVDPIIRKKLINRFSFSTSTCELSEALAARLITYPTIRISSRLFQSSTATIPVTRYGHSSTFHRVMTKNRRKNGRRSSHRKQNGCSRRPISCHDDHPTYVSNSRPNNHRVGSVSSFHREKIVQLPFLFKLINYDVRKIANRNFEQQTEIGRIHNFIPYNPISIFRCRYSKPSEELLIAKCAFCRS